MSAEWHQQAVDKLAADCIINFLYDGPISAGEDPCHQQKPYKPARSALMSQTASGSMHAFRTRERLSTNCAYLRSSVGPLRRSRQSLKAKCSACEALGVVILLTRRGSCQRLSGTASLIWVLGTYQKLVLMVSASRELHSSYSDPHDHSPNATPTFLVYQWISCTETRATLFNFPNGDRLGMPQ